MEPKYTFCQWIYLWYLNAGDFIFQMEILLYCQVFNFQWNYVNNIYSFNYLISNDWSALFSSIKILNDKSMRVWGWGWGFINLYNIDKINRLFLLKYDIRLLISFDLVNVESILWLKLYVRDMRARKRLIFDISDSFLLFQL